jgi:hypothetical protein
MPDHPTAAATAVANADPEVRQRLHKQAVSDAKDAGAEEFLWVHSNRKDDRVVLWEQDRRHPMGGEAFVGGDGAVLVARTPAVEGAIRSGELVEINEPPADHRMRPLVMPLTTPPGGANMPGQPTELGRTLDPIFQSKETEQQQKSAPKEIPVPSGVQMPKDEGRGR